MLLTHQPPHGLGDRCVMKGGKHKGPRARVSRFVVFADCGCILARFAGDFWCFLAISGAFRLVLRAISQGARDRGWLPTAWPCPYAGIIASTRCLLLRVSKIFSRVRGVAQTGEGSEAGAARFRTHPRRPWRVQTATRRRGNRHLRECRLHNGDVQHPAHPLRRRSCPQLAAHVGASLLVGDFRRDVSSSGGSRGATLFRRRRKSARNGPRTFPHCIEPRGK